MSQTLAVVTSWPFQVRKENFKQLEKKDSHFTNGLQHANPLIEEPMVLVLIPAPFSGYKMLFSEILSFLWQSLSPLL